MTSYYAILPYVYEPYLEECLGTLKLPQEDVWVIDGRQPNDPGLAGVINIAVDTMRSRGAEWLIVLNPQIRFGEKGGYDMIELLDKAPHNVNMIFFNDKDSGEIFSWHCCAIRKDVFDTIGKLDPNFYPVYFEDVDFDLRYRKAFKPEQTAFVPIDARNVSYGHSVSLGNTKIDLNALITYFATKWGRHPMATRLQSYEHPFDDENNSLAYWPPAGGQTWDGKTSQD